jgi:glycerophosphoryl diester phosphodiesterase
MIMGLVVYGLAVVMPAAGVASGPPAVDLGTRPLSLVAAMEPGPLKQRLETCRQGPFVRTEFAIGHRGAPLRYPEHTRESYVAAARQGAGILECDVTFTRDRRLVCRHAQCDLHATTNVLATPLASRCSEPFTPADPAAGTTATARCCTSDLTLAEFKSLCGRTGHVNPGARSVAEYLTAPLETERICGTVMSHAESIELFLALGVDMTPELKAPSVPMPYDGYTREQYAQQLLDEYRAAGVAPARVWPQSFDQMDVAYWIRSNPEFADQVVFLDGRDRDSGFDPDDPTTWQPDMDDLREARLRIIAPPLWMLLTLDQQGRIVPSAYARAARAAGLQIITWTLERSGSLADGGGWYYQSVSDAIDGDGDVYEVLDVLARDVGVIGVFADWPATVTYYANCMGLVR